MTSFEQQRGGVGPGWQPLIEKLDADLRAIAPYEVFQIKEKFGGLRFYADVYSDDPWSGRGAELIAAAEEASYRTCEDCGATEDVTTEGPGWVRTLCPDCRDRQNENRRIRLDQATD